MLVSTQLYLFIHAFHFAHKICGTAKSKRREWLVEQQAEAGKQVHITCSNLRKQKAPITKEEPSSASFVYSFQQILLDQRNRKLHFLPKPLPGLMAIS